MIPMRSHRQPEMREKLGSLASTAIAGALVIIMRVKKKHIMRYYSMNLHIGQATKKGLTEKRATRSGRRVTPLKN